jgi:Endonuclease related to archaeal Holliday junction resolvase
MTEIVTVLCVVAAVLLVLLLVVVARFSGYRARHPFTEREVQQARDRSVRRSRSVLTGKIQEHMAPLLPHFAECFNLQEARFVGAPIDYIVFDGLDAGERVEVVLVEIKTGKAGLNRREQLIRDAVASGRVRFEIIRLATETVVAAESDSEPFGPTEDLGSVRVTDDGRWVVEPPP